MWQAGWAFWFVVTTSFAWSYYALARHLGGARPWRGLAVGLAVVAAAVDLVGVVVNLAVVPELAGRYQALDPAGQAIAALAYRGFETLAYALPSVTAFGLYSAAGLLLLPAVWATPRYPRPLAWLSIAAWGSAAGATLVLALAPLLATGPLVLGFGLYAPWAWGNAWWIARAEE